MKNIFTNQQIKTIEKLSIWIALQTNKQTNKHGAKLVGFVNIFVLMTVQ